MTKMFRSEADFTKMLVAMANENMDARNMREVRALVERHDIIFGIWQDESAPHGVGSLIIKGRSLLEQTAAGTLAMEVSVTAIACRELEEAIALKQVVGEPDRLN